MAEWLRSLFPPLPVRQPAVAQTILLENLQMTHDTLTNIVPAKVDNLIAQLVQRVVTRHRYHLHRNMDIRQKVVELNLVDCWNDLGQALGIRLRFKIDQASTPPQVVAYYHGHISAWEKYGIRGDGYQKIILGPIPAEPTPVELATMRELSHPETVKRWTEACLAVFSKAISNGLKVTTAADKPCTLLFDFSSSRTIAPIDANTVRGSESISPTPGDPCDK
jgi:hypothetical protein